MIIRRFVWFTVTLVIVLTPMLAIAQETEPNINQSTKPFILPFSAPPGPDTWLVAQPYGNTTGAYRQRYSTYGASGGIHFGLDLSAPCGTPIVAIADGVVFAIDGPFGSPPHNLMIDHPQYGYASMYGHLLTAPDLTVGQTVRQGEVIALSGTSSGSCNSRAHLHLEIRDMDHAGKQNPIPLIEANWDNLTLQGANPRQYQRNLAKPRQWQTLYDQPQARTGGPIVNDFANSWPYDWATTSLPRLGIVVTQSLSNSLANTDLPAIRQIITGNCCTSFYWSRDSEELRFIDQPTDDAPVGIWGINIYQPEPTPRLVTERLAAFSRDGRYMAFPNNGRTVVERLADGEQWVFDTAGRSVSFSLQNEILWMVTQGGNDWNPDEMTIWLAEVEGGQPRQIATLQDGAPTAWLPNNQILISTRVSPTQTKLSTLSMADGSLTDLGQIPRARDIALSRDRRFISYIIRQNPTPALNGIWLIDLEAETFAPQKLPFFGAYRWRDNHTLLYVPFNPTATHHDFYQYNVLTGETSLLASTGLSITNNEWQISPDGRFIALLTAHEEQVDGIWVVQVG